MEKRTGFSLLYPEGRVKEQGKDSFMLSPQSQKDLELEKLIESIIPSRNFDQGLYKHIKEIFLRPCMDKKTIKYRQDIIADFLNHKQLQKAFERLLPVIDLLSYYRASRFQNQSSLYSLVYRLGELENYIICIDTLKEVFDTLNISQKTENKLSDGLKVFYHEVQRISSHETFIHLKTNLPHLAERIRNIRSVNLGINLDDDLNPVAASLISINRESFSPGSPGVFNTLFHRDFTDLNGITPLHQICRNNQGSTLNLGNSYGKQNRKSLTPLFHDLCNVLKKVCDNIQKALNRYIKINTDIFIRIRSELVFYIFCVKFFISLQEYGLPVCKPEIGSIKKRITIIEESYNVNLAQTFMHKDSAGKIKENIVTNDIRFDENGRIIILTGPNQGGKTVYIQGIGISQVLFQTGLYVPGRKAFMSPVDAIYTHFQVEENITRDLGRFAEEAKRLNNMLDQVTPYSLLLMNESFASTNYTESLHIVRDIMSIFRILGIRVAFATHFHDLAFEIDQINQGIDGNSTLISMVSMVQEDEEGHIRRTYKIKPYPPMGKSYAKEIAEKYNLSFKQMYELFNKRGFIRQPVVYNQNILT